jgi:polyhydroxybutyrate depolymerase
MFFKKSNPSHRLPGWKADRGYDLVIPPNPIGDLLIVIHGFTHDGRVMRALTSPDGDHTHPASLDSVAAKHDLLLCYPNGTSLGMMPGRCWNAGGGANGFCAVAKKAVDHKVDDIRYLEELIAHIGSNHSVERVFLTGISNGAALAHRFATQRPNQVRALAVVAGCNQFAATENLVPRQPVPLLHIHGTADPIWPYKGRNIPALGLLDSVDSSLAIWTQANKASIVEERELRHLRYQDQSVTLRRYEGEAAVVLYRVDGGGHIWPGGQQYMSKRIVGPVHPGFSANATILDFFTRFR